MKHLWKILTVVICSSFIIAQETIAVVDFDGKGVTDIEASALADRFASELYNLGIYRLIERERVGEILEEQGFQQSGCTTAECAVEVGQMLGTELIITGSISKVGNVFSVSSRIINVESGEIYKMSNYDYQGEIGQLLMKGMSIAVNKLVSGEIPFAEFPESNRPDINYNYGIKCLEDNNCFNPEYYFNKAIELDTTFAPAYLALGRIELANDKMLEAIKYMNKAVFNDPYNMEFRNEYYMWTEKYPSYNFPALPPQPGGPRVEFVPYDEPPIPLKRIRPRYPEIAQEAGIEGTVVVQVFVDEKGKVKETVILKGIPNTGLDEAAIKAIRKVSFTPAKYRGKKVGVWISIPVNFILKY
jgi:TonB family protein